MTLTPVHRSDPEPAAHAGGAELPVAHPRRERLPPDQWYPAGVAGVDAAFVQLPDGEQARVLTAGPSGGAPVVLVHGWACSAYSWRHQMPALAAAGYRVVAVELRGHGLSARPHEGECYTEGAMVEFLARTLDALALDRLALVGHSLGAAVATRLALRQPERVARLATIGGVGFGRTSLVPLLRHVPDAVARPFLPLAGSRALFGLVLRLVGGPGQYGPRDVEEYWAATQFPGFTMALWQLVQHFDWRELTPGERERLRMPHLLVSGGRDRLVRTHPNRRASSGNGVREVVLEGVGHAAQEEAPEAVNELLLSFLEPWAAEAAGPG